MSSNFAECWYYTNFKWPYFPNGWGYSHMVRHAGSPICIAHADMTLTWSKVKVTGLLKFRKFVLALSPLQFWCGAQKLMLDYDSMGPSLQLSQKAITWIQTSPNVDLYENLRIAWGYSHMVWYAGSLICIVRADMILIQSKVKVKVRELLKFPKLHFCKSISSHTIDLRRYLPAAAMTVSPLRGYFLQAGYSSWHPSHSVKALKAMHYEL